MFIEAPTRCVQPQKSTRCTYFFSPTGCNRGDSCMFSHVDDRAKQLEKELQSITQRKTQEVCIRNSGWLAFQVVTGSTAACRLYSTECGDYDSSYHKLNCCESLARFPHYQSEDGRRFLERQAAARSRQSRFCERWQRHSEITK